MAGNRGGEHTGEELEKAGGHGGNFKIQLSRKTRATTHDLWLEVET
jgi:hypothetical protein